MFQQTGPAVSPRGTQELFTKVVTRTRFGIEQRFGEGCSAKRPVLERVSGAFVLWECVLSHSHNPINE